MSPEEKAEMEAAAKADAEASAEATEPSSKTSAAASAAAASAAADPLGQSVAGAANEAAQAEVGVSGENQALALHSSASGTSTPTAKADGEADAVGAAKKPESSKKGKPKLTPEQKAQLEALEKKQDEEKQKRIETLQDKLVQRIRPFVDAKNPGDINDAETKAFENRIRIEAEDLKLESFGVEVSHIIFFFQHVRLLIKYPQMLHTIGQVYITKAGNFLKSKKFFGGGFFGRLKEKGGMMKEGWNLLGSA